MSKRIATKDTGVYYRFINESKTSNKKVKCFYITYKNLDNKMREIKVGRATEGVTQQFAKQTRREVLSKMFKNEDHHTVIVKRKKLNSTIFDDIFQEYYQKLIYKNNGTETKSHREIMSKYTNHIKLHLGQRDIKNISKNDIIEIQSKIAKMKKEVLEEKDGKLTKSYVKKYSPKTVNMIIELIRSIFNYGIKEDFLTTNPASNIELLKVDNERARYLSKSEVKTLLEYLEEEYKFDDRHILLFTKILLETGTRVSSCMNIKVGDIDFATKKVTLRDFKNTSTYYGILSQNTISIIEMFYKKTDREKKLFQCHQNTYSRHLKKAFDKLFNYHLAKDDRKNRVVLHSLRHTFATTVLNNGQELNTVRHLLNHRSMETTLRYSKMKDSTINNAVKGLYD